MKVFYDGYIFSAQESGGISRYFAELIKRLPSDWSPTIALGDAPNSVEVTHPRLRVRQALPFDETRPRALGRRLARASQTLHDARATYDVAHPTFHFQSPKRFIARGRWPLVVTVHDMIAEHFEELDRNAEIEAKRKMIEAADAIICVSENTRRELQERHRVPDSKITVIYLAAAVNCEMASESEAVPLSPYCLFLGNRAIYKNFARTLLAFEKIAKQWPELSLCVVGKSFNGQEVELIRALRISDRVQRIGQVTDARLASLYRASEGLLYPSLHEGFGLPPLEAMACGTVVIASNISSLPEAVGDAAIMVNPESVEEIAGALLSLRDLGSAREDLILRGLERARKFSWDETAKRTIDVYKSVAS